MENRAAMFCVLIFFIGLIVLGNCSKEECPPLPFAYLKNGTITATTQTSFRFSCDDGFFRIGPDQIRCRMGKWIPPFRQPPVCLRSEGFCDPPPAIPHANIWGNNFEVGSVVMYQCHSGYRILGRNRRTCERNLAWSGLTPTCQAEEEPLRNIAVRLDEEFIKNAGKFSNDSRARSLDDASLLKGLELVILLDRSSSVDPVDFQRGIDFIKFLLREFGIDGDNPIGTRAAIVTFGSEADVVFNLNSKEVSNIDDANQKLDELQPAGGGTAMVQAMTTVFIDISPLLRPEAKRALFLITDGVPTIRDSDVTPEDVAFQLKDAQNFEIFTVGIGKGINRDLLTRIASSPPENHVFILKKYSQLEDMISIIKTLPGERPKPGLNKCGFIDESLKPTEYQRWPWLAAVYISFPLPDAQPLKMSLCAGALICSDWVLTAASCFHETHRRNVILSMQEVFVVMGKQNLLEIDKTQINYYATDVHTHPDFDAFSPLQNNLALIQLNEAVPLNGTFRPICLPKTNLVIPLHEDLTTNTSTAGWGRPLKLGFNKGINTATTDYNLRTRPISLAEEGECSGRLRDRPLGNIFCAGFGEMDCLGNIGSPIIGLDPNTEIQHILGVLSDKSDCNQGFSRFTELRQFLPWIDRTTRNCRQHHEM